MKEFSISSVSWLQTSFISVVLAFGETLPGPSSESQADPGYCSVSSSDGELRCCPGVEGGYLAEAHHLLAQLREGLSA